LKFVSGQQYMKRSSAHPFVVEVKSTRSSRSSLSDAFTRTPPGPSLWDGVALEAGAKSSAPQIQPRSPVAEAPKTAAQEPSRRVLPALVPLYVPPEPEPQDEAPRGVARTSRTMKAVRKPRARPAVVETTDDLAKVTAAMPRSAPLAAHNEPVISALLHAHSAPTTQVQTEGRARDRRHPPELRRGGRWKRRLPRACW
jgi:hypothetical protein